MFLLAQLWSLSANYYRKWNKTLLLQALMHLSSMGGQSTIQNLYACLEYPIAYSSPSCQEIKPYVKKSGSSSK